MFVIYFKPKITGREFGVRYALESFKFPSVFRNKIPASYSALDQVKLHAIVWNDNEKTDNEPEEKWKNTNRIH